MSNTPIIPLTITVHLGAPDESAENVTLPFSDYIKNVASSEIYPTWPISSLRSNIYAQISFALNRVYTEFYRIRGYNFDITSRTAFDQAFVNGRDIFENISLIVDEIFDDYVRRQGNVEPLFTSYCDGIATTCGGLSQWGTVSLANNGLNSVEILQRYYGRDIEIVTNAPVGSVTPSAPLIPLRLGSAGNDVLRVQIRLNRISSNYPGIPKIYPLNGIFSQSTEEAVKVFQEVFDLLQDGVVGTATWYRIQYIYSGVKRLSELNSEGLTIGEVSNQFPEVLAPGDEGEGVRVLQYYLSYVSQFLEQIPPPGESGVFDDETEASVLAFQKTYGLTQDGIVGEITWDLLYNTYLGMVEATIPEYSEGVIVPFPGRTLSLGDEGDDVKLFQEYLSYIAGFFPELPAPTPDGIFGPETEAAVIAFQEFFTPSFVTGVVGAPFWKTITDLYQDLYIGSQAQEGQFPGYAVQQGEN